MFNKKRGNYATNGKLSPTTRSLHMCRAFPSTDRKQMCFCNSACTDVTRLTWKIS